MIGVLIIPTGMGAPIGGHAGDANPVCKLLASCCDTLITHPNVVNASDINEMPENVLYVDGWMLDLFLGGSTRLRRTEAFNRILLVTNKSGGSDVAWETRNAVSAAEVTIGADINICELKAPLVMEGGVQDGGVFGRVGGVEEAIEQIARWRGLFDAVAIHTPIDVDRKTVLNYYKDGGVNPWGFVESMVSGQISCGLQQKGMWVPVAHAPVENTDPKDTEVFNVFDRCVHPRMAPEAISRCYLHCVLKGLHRAPRYTKMGGISVEDVGWAIFPMGCDGKAYKYCREAGVCTIIVEENKVVGCLEGGMGDVENYWEAAGYVSCLRAGVAPYSTRVGNA